MEYCVIIQYMILETWLKYTAWLSWSIPLFVTSAVPKTIITQDLSLLSCTFKITNQNIVFTILAQSWWRNTPQTLWKFLINECAIIIF